MMNKAIFLFALSGICGFFVDAGILFLLKNSLGLYFARAVSFFLAVVTTWLINRSFTFRGRTSDLPIVTEFFHYFIAMSFGGLVNYLTYVLAINISDLVKCYPVIGVAMGSLAGMLLNWISSSKLIFKKKEL